jgi:hypothetical protein
MSNEACLWYTLLCVFFGPFGLICWPCVPGDKQLQQQQQQQQQVVIMSGAPAGSEIRIAGDGGLKSIGA